MGDLFEIGGKQLGGGLDVLEDLGDDIQEGYDELVDVTTKFYAGNYFEEEFQKHDNNLRKYIQGNVPFSLLPIFNPINGLPRSLVWAGIFIALYFTLFGTRLIQPVIVSFKEKGVSSAFVDIYRTTGVQRPTVTICPKGDGLRCDCKLFKLQLCSVRSKAESRYFSNLVCESQILDDSALTTLCADDWSPATLELYEDPCGTETLSGEILKERVLDRRRRGKPYITKEEMILYAGVKLGSENTHVFLSKKNDLTRVNETWINYNFLSVYHGKMCMQVVPDNGPQSMQILVGSKSGYRIIVNGTFDSVVRSSPVTGVDVFMDYDFEEGEEPILLMPIPVSSGLVTTIGYEMQTYKRKQGYGDLASRTCLPEGQSRRRCQNQLFLEAVQKSCDCTNTSAALQFGINTSVVNYGAFGCDFKCYDETDPVNTGFETCPTLCDSMTGSYTVTVADQNRFGRKQIKAEYGSAGSVVTLNIGCSKLVIEELSESIAKSFSAMVGGIGGTLNLYFGPAFMPLFAYLELMIIGTFLSFKSDIEDDIEDHKVEKSEKKDLKEEME